MREATGLARMISYIDAERARQGLSGRELSERSGLGVTTVNRILKGSAAPGLDTLDAIAQALGYTLESLLLVGMKAAHTARESEELVVLFEGLPDDDRAVVLDLARVLTDRRKSARRS